MDLCVAVVRVRSDGAEKTLRDYHPSDFDLLLTSNPRSSSQHLPRTRTTPGRDLAESALEFASSFVSGRHLRHGRVVRVPLARNADSTSSTLICIPLSSKDKLCADARTKHLEFHGFEHLRRSAWNGNISLESETRHLILRLDQWLREGRQMNPRFLAGLFLRNPVASRLRHCAHNPAHLQELRTCSKRIGAVNRGARDGVVSTELADEVRDANEALAQMLALEKCEVFIMNALFGSGLPYRIGREQTPSYFARGRPQPQLADRALYGTYSSDSSADSTSWTEEFPLHLAAYSGRQEAIRQLLTRGLDPNLPDRDSWTPLHYAAWYGQLGALQALLNYGNCAVNVRNKNGSTPLHFASCCGHQYVVELLLTHPDILVDAKDNDGKTPIDLCDCVPKPEWQAAAQLLRAARVEKLPKIQVDLMDSSNVMLTLVNGAETTAADLHSQMAAELRLESCAKLFAVWVCSDSLEVQLKAEHKPVLQMQKWKTKVLPKWSDGPNPGAEEPQLVFRRDARVSLTEEKKAKLTDSALALLYHEAHRNYLRGLYPCSEHDVAMLAALMFQLIHGNFDPKKDKQHLANERTLRTLLPDHRLKTRNSTLIQKITNEHKQVTQKGAKSVPGLQYQFLSFCWNLRVYGSAFFNGMLFMAKPMKGALQVHAGVNDFGLHLLNQETKVLFQSYPIKSLEWTYEGDKPFIEFRSRSGGSAHVFTLRTRQASHVHMLLTKLLQLNSSRSSSNLSHRST